MKLLSTILLAFCVASLAIGIHQLYYYEVQEVYWILSLSVLLFLIYKWVNSKIAEKEKVEDKATEKQQNKKNTKKQYVDKENSNFTPPKKKRKKRN
ncbi:hypothetical protein WAF17_12500 [Bernardetia sp. ABR2-2B]|uniref:hypothetical protein n=1 Tax=Bernardetia sp. ABR2-2B TaxID=3127472 RepID=UPI0030CDA76B